jgi:hypothetical protein
MLPDKLPQKTLVCPLFTPQPDKVFSAIVGVGKNALWGLEKIA